MLKDTAWMAGGVTGGTEHAFHEAGVCLDHSSDRRNLRWGLVGEGSRNRKGSQVCIKPTACAACQHTSNHVGCQPLCTSQQYPQCCSRNICTPHQALDICPSMTCSKRIYRSSVWPRQQVPFCRTSASTSARSPCQICAPSWPSMQMQNA